MKREFLCLMIVFVSVIFTGCSINVPPNKVFGAYKVSYPFGTETITLNRDGTFMQQVVIKDQTPVTVRGKWEYDSKGSRVNLDGFMAVVDGFGHMKSEWRTSKPGIASFDVEMHWFRIIMASAAAYPYVKQ